MFKDNKKISFSIVIFLVSFIFIVFAHSLNMNNSRINLSLKSKKENSIFFEKSSHSENYISIKNLRTKTFQIFSSKDIIPDFAKKIEEHILINKLIKLPKRIVEILIERYSILERYKERILRI